jgi:hypothetical protein
MDADCYRRASRVGNAVDSLPMDLPINGIRRFPDRSHSSVGKNSSKATITLQTCGFAANFNGVSASSWVTEGSVRHC